MRTSLSNDRIDIRWKISLNAILEVHNLHKEFHGNPPAVALDSVSFELGDGEVLGLLGPNGAGKTTCIRVLISVLVPESGKVSYFGRDLQEYRSEILSQVGFASTYTHLPMYLTVEENFKIHCMLFGVSQKDSKLRIDEYLEKFGLAEYRKRTFIQLSAGQRTRVMLVKAFLHHPKVVLLDEPTASLDPDVAFQVREFILTQQKERGVSILLTSHNMEEVSALCSRVIFLSHGKIVAEDSPKRLASSVRSAEVHLDINGDLDRARAILSAAQYAVREGSSRSQLIVESAEDRVPTFLQFLVRNDIQFARISIERPTLEEFFMSLAKRSGRPA